MPVMSAKAITAIMAVPLLSAMRRLPEQGKDIHDCHHSLLLLIMVAHPNLLAIFPWPYFFVKWVDIQREDASCDTDHSHLTSFPFMIARLPERPAGALSLCRYWVGSCRFLNQTIRATRSYKWESFSSALANTVGPLSASHAEAELGSF